MKIEIDQSGRIEETNRDTILMFSNGISYSVKITARTKRRLQEIYRQIGKPTVFMVNTFAIGVYLLVKNHLKSITTIVIDIEYAGWESVIIGILKNIFKDKKVKNPPEVFFTLIGKKSRAHKIAIKVFRKWDNPQKVLSLAEIISESLRMKNGRPVLTYPVSRTGNSTPLRPNLNK